MGRHQYSSLEDLIVRRHDPVQPVVEAILDMVPELVKPYTTSAHVRFMQTPKGVNVVVETDDVDYIPKWQVKRDGTKVTVGYGTIDNHVPTIKKVPIDGKMAEGKEEPIPSIDLADTGPSKELLSWLCLQVSVESNGLVNLQKNPEAYAVVHVKERPQPLSKWEVLAQIHWKDEEVIERIEQIRMHHIKHVFFKRNSQHAGGLHFFTAV